MSQDQPEPPGKIKLDPNPNPEDEAEAFSNADERREARKNSHDLAVLDRNLGWIGRCTGSTNPSLNVAAVIAAALALALFLCLGGAAINGLEKFSVIIERLIAGILTVAGFIFGVTQSSEKR